MKTSLVSIGLVLLGLTTSHMSSAEGRDASHYDKDSLPPGVKLHSTPKTAPTDSSQAQVSEDPRITDHEQQRRAKPATTPSGNNPGGEETAQPQRY